MSDETANDRDLVELTVQKAQQPNAHIGPNPFRDEPVVETLREVLDDPSQKPTATLAQPMLRSTDLDLDRAIRLRWTLRDIRAKRTILSPVSPYELRILLEMGLIEMRGDVRVLTSEGDGVAEEKEETMKSITMIALALAFFVCSVSAHAKTPDTQKRTGRQITHYDLHSGCTTKHQKMIGAPCH